MGSSYNPFPPLLNTRPHNKSIKNTQIYYPLLLHLDHDLLYSSLAHKVCHPHFLTQHQSRTQRIPSQHLTNQQYLQYHLNYVLIRKISFGDSLLQIQKPRTEIRCDIQCINNRVSYFPICPYLIEFYFILFRLAVVIKREENFLQVSSNLFKSGVEKDFENFSGGLPKFFSTRSISSLKRAFSISFSCI